VWEASPTPISRRPLLWAGITVAANTTLPFYRDLSVGASNDRNQNKIRNSNNTEIEYCECDF
jgi:hypothetical protein